jgi:hypothetical protein
LSGITGRLHGLSPLPCSEAMAGSVISRHETIAPERSARSSRQRWRVRDDRRLEAGSEPVGTDLQ